MGAISFFNCCIKTISYTYIYMHAYTHTHTHTHTHQRQMKLPGPHLGGTITYQDKINLYGKIYFSIK